MDFKRFIHFLRSNICLLRPYTFYHYGQYMLHRSRMQRHARYCLQQWLLSTPSINIVLGAGNTRFDGWFSTDYDILNITSSRDWKMFFTPGSIDKLLCEHVLEHLSQTECTITLQHCYRYLKRGGVFRIAVPDGYRKDAEYVAEVSPPKDGHKMLFTIDNLVPLLEDIGFHVIPLEYFDAKEIFHFFPWDERDGYIERSFRFDTQEKFRRGDLRYTSLIVDAKKNQCLSSR